MDKKMPSGKKIGILTYHNSINYGSVLQAYALTSFLKLKGYDVEIIDYKPKRLKEIYRLFNKGFKLKTIAKNILVNMPLVSMYKNRIKKFKQFNEKFLPISKETYFFDNDLNVLNDKYDVLLCGSDQIWNTECLDCDDAYFLPIEHKARKISYAASINHDDYNIRYKDDERLKQMLNDFDVLSVREKSGCDMLAKFLDNKKSISNDIDPTLLLEKRHFENIESNPFISGEYIFMFSVKYSDSVLNVCKEIAKRTGLTIYSLMTQQKSYRFVKFNKSYVKILPDKLSPSDFLSYINNAKYVVADSFHGVAFSIIYQKQFFAINEQKKDGNYCNDERIVNILSQLGLEERYLTEEQFKVYDITKQINYEKCNKALNNLRKISETNLIKAIEGNANDTK